MSIKISKDKKKEHLEFIKSNFHKYSQRAIARRLNLGKTTVNRWSNEVGLKFKKDAVNENFFDKLNEKSAYILGFIFADGNVAWNPSKGYYTLTITAAEKDKDHLEEIRRIISSSKPLLYSNKTKSYRLIVNSKKICLKLMEFGVIPKKSLVVTFPKIPKDSLNHFLRGVIDGDGCVSYNNRKRSPYFEIRIYSGSQAFCEGVKNNIFEAIKIDSVVRKIHQNTYGVSYSCARGETLAKYIYSDSTIFLNRKYEKYKESIRRKKNGKKL